MRASATKPPPRLRWTKYWRSEYLEDDCCYILAQMKRMVTFDFIVDISTSTISRRLFNKLYRIKQCAISIADGMLLHRLERGSIQKEQNAIYVEAEYQAAKALPGYRAHYSGKIVMIVLDNAPAHQQTEKRLPFHDDAVLLRLGLKSPMCNPTEDSFSVLQAAIKAFLRLSDDEMTAIRYKHTAMTEQCMSLPERAAVHFMAVITPHLVVMQHPHALRAVEAARHMGDMQYTKLGRRAVRKVEREALLQVAQRVDALVVLLGKSLGVLTLAAALLLLVVAVELLLFDLLSAVHELHSAHRDVQVGAAAERQAGRLVRTVSTSSVSVTSRTNTVALALGSLEHERRDEMELPLRAALIQLHTPKASIFIL